MMMWKRFGTTIRDRVHADKVSLASVERDTGMSHARVHDAASGKPMGTENYLALCRWLNVHPSSFWSGDVRDDHAPESAS